MSKPTVTTYTDHLHESWNAPGGGREQVEKEMATWFQENAMPKTDTTDYERGVANAKKAISAKIKDMACYFDKWTCHSGKYSSANATESLNPDQIAEIITEVEVEDE